METEGRDAELAPQGEHPSLEDGSENQGRSKLFKASQIKNNLAFSGTLGFYDVGNELLLGNHGVIYQYISQSMGGRGNAGQVTLAVA